MPEEPIAYPTASVTQKDIEFTRGHLAKWCRANDVMPGIEAKLWAKFCSNPSKYFCQGWSTTLLEV